MKKLVLLRRVIPALAMLSVLAFAAHGSGFPVRQADEDVNSPAVRERAGLRPNTNLLFNGWGVTPAGNHVLVSDLALKMIVAPDQQHVIATHGGFNDEGVSVLDLATQKRTQFIPLDEAWNGIAFNKDGQRFYVSGGQSGRIHVFTF